MVPDESSATQKELVGRLFLFQYNEKRTLELILEFFFITSPVPREPREVRSDEMRGETAWEAVARLIELFCEAKADSK